jgi:hypothetical protein
MATALRNFEPPVRFVNPDGTLTDRAQGFLRGLFRFTGADTGQVPIGSIGGDGVTPTNYLDETGNFTVPAPQANPTALVGLTAVNGTATTYMRSDGAPPIDLSIAPTWTGSHIFAAGVTMQVASGTTLSFSVGTSLTVGTTATVTGGFGCNSKTAQVAATVGAAVVTTAATNASPWGYATQAQADDIVTRLNTIRAALVSNGILV